MNKDRPAGGAAKLRLPNFPQRLCGLAGWVELDKFFENAFLKTTVEQELREYFMQLSSAEQTSILQLMKTIVSEKTQPQERISIGQYNREIDEALADIENGETYSHEEVVKMAKDW